MRVDLWGARGSVPSPGPATVRYGGDTSCVGVTLEDGPVTVSKARIVEATDAKSIVELVIHEGRNRIVRRLLDEVGHPVKQLTRTRIGPVSLGRLGVGKLRELSTDELGALLDATGL